MPADDSTSSQITEAITILQDAIRKEAYDKKAARADIVRATNILLGLLGLKGVAPDMGVGQ